MHGLVHAELRDFAVERLGRERWSRTLREHGVADRIYRFSDTYPDAELLACVALLAEALGADQQELLREFGKVLATGLIATYGPLVEPRWGAVDLFEHTERVIHRAVRLQDPDADPPRLRVTRTGESEVRIVYDSPRRLCSLAKGLIDGIATSYGEDVVTTEDDCMLEGAPVCLMHVRVGG